MWLLLMELEKEVEDENGNEICTDRTVWDILCEMAVLHQVVLFVCFTFVSYFL
jgi:hypothetical protein